MAQTRGLYSFFTPERCSNGPCRGNIACYTVRLEEKAMDMRYWECLMCNVEPYPAQLLQYGKVVAVQKRLAPGESVETVWELPEPDAGDYKVAV